jgi:hypothetical protein
MVIYGDEAGHGLSEPTEYSVDDDNALDEEVQSNDELAFPEIVNGKNLTGTEGAAHVGPILSVEKEASPALAIEVST